MNKDHKKELSSLISNFLKEKNILKPEDTLEISFNIINNPKVLIKETSSIISSEELNDILSQEPRLFLYESGLKARACNTLAHFSTIRDLVKCTERNLERLRGIGEVTIKDIKEVLSKYNLSLGMDV